jgi:hypothetical protein
MTAALCAHSCCEGSDLLRSEMQVVGRGCSAWLTLSRVAAVLPENARRVLQERPGTGGV